MTYWLSFISTGRPGNVVPMQDLTEPGCWYVKPGEAEAYRAAGANQVKEVVGNVAAARNAALQDAVDRDMVSVQLSDDLKKISVLDWGESKPAEWRDVRDQLLATLRDYPEFFLAGVSPTDNPFYANERLNTRAFCVGDMMAIAPSEPRFDEGFTLKEDYDFTCQHLERYGGVLRLDWVMPSFAHRTNSGGAVAVRTEVLEQEMIANLKWKWPTWIRDNPKRPNEVLLTPGRKQREKHQ